MANVDPSRIISSQKSSQTSPHRIALSAPAESSVDFFAEFASLPIREVDFEFTADPQDRYDDDLQEYGNFDAQFRNNFFRYSRDFQDRRGGAPGIDQDFATSMHQEPARARAEGSMDDRIREEILDLFTRDRTLVADDVSAQVEDGLVTLTGTVVDSDMRLAIEDAVQTVPGVESVENRLGLD